jgi:Uma2 family endonuclease
MSVELAIDELDEPDTDESVVLHDVSWDLYRQLAKLRGESAVPRLTYLDGMLEIMSPSQSHDSIKECLGRLVEAWAEERGIDITGLGSWTLRRRKKRGGVEPDACYIVGEPFDDERRFPDLAIEVVWTSWKVSKLEVYRRLKVHEVWVWRRGRIHVYVLHDGEYVEGEQSTVFAGIDLVLLARLAETRNQSAAVRELRALVRSGPR